MFEHMLWTNPFCDVHVSLHVHNLCSCRHAYVPYAAMPARFCVQAQPIQASEHLPWFEINKANVYVWEDSFTAGLSEQGGWERAGRFRRQPGALCARQQQAPALPKRWRQPNRAWKLKARVEAGGERQTSEHESNSGNQKRVLKPVARFEARSASQKWGYLKG